jgi:RNA polymerase sigma-70 factor (ECF subfamily)
MLDVIYLTFNEGYSASAGEALVRQDLCAEAIRLGRLVCSHPRVGVPRAHALVALMLLQASRLATRVDAAGDLLLLAEQNRSKWDRALIGLGLHHLRQAAQGHELSSYHLEAEIAACHATAPTYEETDWRRILECYDALCARDPSPVVALNRVVARSNVDGPAPALAALDAIRSHPALATYYPAHATRATLLAALGHRDEATEHFRQAIALTASEPIKRFLQRRIEFLASS